MNYKVVKVDKCHKYVIENIRKERQEIYDSLKNELETAIILFRNHSIADQMSIRNRLIVRHKEKLFIPIINNKVWQEILEAVRDEDLERVIKIKYSVSPSFKGKHYLTFLTVLTPSMAEYYFYRN